VNNKGEKNSLIALEVFELYDGRRLVFVEWEDQISPEIELIARRVRAILCQFACCALAYGHWIL
jgi:hypothetical protein